MIWTLNSSIDYDYKKGVKMRKRSKGLTVAIMAAGVLALSGCGSMTLPSFGMGSTAESEHFVYQGIDFGPAENENFKKGVIDGCTTAGGNYAKDHTLFKGDMHYKAGWESGRLKCGRSTAKKS